MADYKYKGILEPIPRVGHVHNKTNRTLKVQYHGTSHTLKPGKTPIEQLHVDATKKLDLADHFCSTYANVKLRPDAPAENLVEVVWD